ncbi:hypothetical protein NLI96_g1131 [Meripilus lineatus]|uniref:Uncharacterized protein n=1 Tax=Meripilus lineatus TaxID=2056292 RepID=A0AAD5VCK6_9APHY|nr:hypothetical protein NLI96_g1131 [Physisporinus lineatus]
MKGETKTQARTGVAIPRPATTTTTPGPPSNSRHPKTPDPIPAFANTGGLGTSILGSFDLFMTTQVPDEHRGGRRARHRNAMAYSIQVAETSPGKSPHPPPARPQPIQIPSASPQPMIPPSIDTPPHPTSTSPSPLPLSGSTTSTFIPRTLRRKPRRAILRQRSSCSLCRKGISLSIYDSGHRRHHHRDSASVDQPSFISLPHHQPNNQKPEDLAPQTRSLDLDRNDLNSNLYHHHRLPLPLPFRITNSNAYHVNNVNVNANANEVPLGHPTRPLYTAIRKGMSRPSSPPPPLELEGGRRSLNIPAPSVSPTSAGFSLSGEVELRLALAKARRMESSEDGHSAGVFAMDPAVAHEDVHGDERKKNSNSVRGRVVKFGRGLKELVKWRPRSPPPER